MERPLELLRDAKTIAVVGIAPDPAKPSHYVSKYLIEAGFEVYLVNPIEEGNEILGRTVYPSIVSLPEPVDLVDIFRRPEHVPPVIDDAIEAGARAVWMQLGIVNEEAAQTAREAGLEVVMDRCTMIDHQRLAWTPS